MPADPEPTTPLPGQPSENQPPGRKARRSGMRLRTPDKNKQQQPSPELESAKTQPL